ncbi:MAG TPA: PQQ-dependent sugar dehydrogenase, partial [Thermomicrobiales bacterium]|nr:PQQ-dependent sugar dehydrogenase [Thermomicrobiales bacterium]
MTAERGRASRQRTALALAALLALIAAWPGSTLAANVPPQFHDALVTTVAGKGPTALAWLPNGDVLIADQGGTLYRLPAGAVNAVVALDLTGGACTDGEEGLLGVAVDPDFTNHPFVYTYETVKNGQQCVNRVSRWTVTGGTTIDASSQKLLIDNIPTPSAYHKGGDLEFGGDGDLYVSVGDGECDLADPNRCQDDNPNARRLDVLLGKILRIDRDGKPPADNPFM